jgi:nucleotide-binding universal stress UspA family protein
MYKNIVVTLDGSKLAECVLPHVDALVKAYNPERVTFVRVVEPWVPFVKDADGSAEDIQYTKHEIAAKSNAVDYLEKVSGNVKYAPTKVSTEVLVGRPAEQIAEYSGKKKADLIVIATHGRSGVTRWAMGSVADRLLQIAPIPVMMIRARGCGGV